MSKIEPDLKLYRLTRYEAYECVVEAENEEEAFFIADDEDLWEYEGGRDEESEELTEEEVRAYRDCEPNPPEDAAPSGPAEA